MLATRLLMAARSVSIAATSSGAASSSSTLSVARPDGVGEGTLLVAFVASSGAPSVTPPTGWTRRARPDTGLFVFTKQADASEPSSYTFTLSSARTSQGFIVALGSGQYDAVGAGGSSASPASAPAVTATAANSIALAWYSRRTSASVAFSTPSGWTALVADSDASAPSGAVFYKQVNAGTTGAASSTPTPSMASVGIQIVVKPR